MDDTKLNELKQIFIEEFFNTFSEILTTTQDEFIKNYLHRINIILMNYHNKQFNELKSNNDLFNIIFKKIIKEYYIPIKQECKNYINKPKEEIKYLNSFQKHCSKNRYAKHKCGGEFLIIKNTIKNIKIIICQKCNLIYKSNEIIMFCSIHNCEFYSKENNLNEEKLKPATWEKYHCPIMLNQQMKCSFCNDYLWIINTNNLFCKKCNKEFNPINLIWKCIICKKKFKSNIKEYNIFEFIAMKNSVKNALINQIIIKPIFLPCKCHDKNPLDLNFYHNKNCDGILYEGNNFSGKIIVCSKCKTFVSINKYNWICPICEKNFHCEETESFPISDLDKIKNDFFTFNDRDKIVEEEKNEFNYIKKLENNLKQPKRVIRSSLNDLLRKERSLNLNMYNKSISSCSKDKTENSYNINISNNNNNNNICNNIFNNYNYSQIKSYKYRNDKINLLEDMNNNDIINENFEKVRKRNISFEGNYSLFTDKRIMDVRVYEVPKQTELKEKLTIENEINNCIFKKINHNEKNLKNQILEKEREKYKENSKEFSPNHFRKKAYQKIQVQKLNNSRLNTENSLNNILIIPPRVRNKSEFIFNEKDYKILNQLGEGTFGKIYLVEDSNKNLFCMKKMFAKNEKTCDKMIKEYSIMSKIKHNNIISIIGISKNTLNLSANILMEVAITDWEKEINEKQRNNIYYKEDQLFNIIKQLIKALSFLQKKNICHRDIKVQNILIFNNNIYKIADFGEIKQISGNSNNIHSVRGTHLFMSPILFKAFNNKEYNIKHNPFKSDVFSLGLCLLFASTLNIKYLCKIRDYFDDTKLQLFIMSVISQKYSLKFVQFLCKMLILNENQRVDFIDLEKEIDNL